MAAKQLPLNKAGDVAATTTSTSLPPGLASMFVVEFGFTTVFVNWANEEDVDIELNDEVECEVEANVVDDWGGVNVAGVDGAAAGDDVPFVAVPVVAVAVVVVLVSSCFIR